MTTSTAPIATPAPAVERAHARTLLSAWRSEVGLPLLLGVLATVVTATGSWIPSFWGDEAATAMSAQRSWSSLLLEVRHVDAVHALYYAIMHVWVQAFGAGPLALRFPSTLALGATVAGLVVLTRLSDGTRVTAVVVAVCTTLLPRLSHQGEEARAYAMDAAVATWIIVAVCATLRSRIRPRTGWTIVAALTIVGTYLFLYVGLMLVVTGVFVLSSSGRSRHLRAWLVSTATVVVAVAPIALVGMSQKAQVAFLAHRVTSDPASVLVSVYFSRTWVAVVCWTLVLIAVAAAVRTHAQSGWETGRQPAPSLVGIGVVWGVLPLALLVAVNPVAHEFSARYATFTAPGIALLVASGIEVLGRGNRWVGLFAGGLTLALVVPVWLGQRTPAAFNASDWSTTAALVRDHARPGDQVAFDVTVRPSRRELLALRTYPSDFARLKEVQVTTPYWENTSWDDRALTVEQAADAGRFHDGRVWLLQDAHGGVVDHEGEATLRDAGFHRVRAWRAPTSELVLFQR
ncbi:hypothetical protein [Curtobacterium sp. Curtsp57]|uniref:glycosyltransferase family 39 protein n=1 Tax=Curtobacterium sp. Curtsp57 TaxID=3243047 RepID=UPI0039B3D74E